MQLFFSLSSIGYLAGSILFFISSYKLHRSYVHTGSEASKIFGTSLVYLGIVLFLYGSPPIFYSANAYVLGWFNVIANIFLGIWIAYSLKLTTTLIYSEKVATIFFRTSLFWTAFILVPVNILYLPLPTFDQYGLEIWNYQLPLFINTGLVILLVTWFMGISLLRYSLEANIIRSYIFWAIGYMVGGVGAALVTYTHSSSTAIIGYTLLLVLGFISISLTFFKTRRKKAPTKS